MATKKAARKNSEEEIKGKNSLYFFQGKEGRVENLIGLDFFKAVPKLSDEQILEQAKNLSKAHKDPKYSIVTRSYYTADEADELNKVSGAKEGDKNFIRANQVKDVKHAEIPLYKAEAEGAYSFFFPDIYKRDDAEKYLINDTVFEVESFTIADHTAWNRTMHEKKLFEIFARQATVLDEINALTPTDDELNGLRAEIPQLIGSRDALIKRYNALLLDEKEPLETVENVLGRRKLAEARLKEARERLKEGEKGTDALAVAEKAAPLQEKLEAINEENYRVYMEFVHEFAVREGLTTDTFDDWYAAADQQSKANAMGWVSAGNALRTSGRAARPMTREEERARELRKLVN